MKGGEATTGGLLQGRVGGGGRSKGLLSAYLLPWLRVACGFQDLRAGKRDQ